jgi:formimidoylglutamate deiminase
MTVYFTSLAFVDNAWQTDTRIHVDPKGFIQQIDTDSSPGEADIHLAGPAIPALANCHSHAFQRLFAGLTEQFGSSNDSFWSWRERMYQLLAMLSPDDLGVISRQLYIEMLKAGYTRVGEFHYLHNRVNGEPFDNLEEMSLQLIAAARDVGIGLTLLPVLYQYAGFNKAPVSNAQQRFTLTNDQYLELLGRLDKYTIDSAFTLGVAPHSLRAIDLDDFINFYAQLPPAIPTHIHIAEQRAEVEQCQQATRQRPVEYLYNRLQPGPNWTLIHATHLTDEELGCIQQSQAVIGLCPTTEANLGDGICHPGILSQDKPCRWAIGSDSHISVDAIEELRWLEYGQRLQTHHRAITASAKSLSTGTTLWQSALAGGAQSIRASAGISVGQLGDWLVLDQGHPSLSGITEHYLFDALIFSGRPGTAIKDVYVAGHPVIEDGHHPAQETCQKAFTQLVEQLIS